MKIGPILSYRRLNFSSNKNDLSKANKGIQNPVLDNQKQRIDLYALKSYNVETIENLNSSYKKINYEVKGRNPKTVSVYIDNSDNKIKKIEEFSIDEFDKEPTKKIKFLSYNEKGKLYALRVVKDGVLSDVTKFTYNDSGKLVKKNQEDKYFSNKTIINRDDNGKISRVKNELIDKNSGKLIMRRVYTKNPDGSFKILELGNSFKEISIKTFDKEGNRISDELKHYC